MSTATFAIRMRVIGAAMVAALGVLGCEQFDPVKSDNLCERDDGHAISMLCPQCSEMPFAWNCSECFKQFDPDPEMCETNPNPPAPSTGPDAGRAGEGGEAGSEAGAGGQSGGGGEGGAAGEGGAGGEGGTSGGGGGGSGGMSGGDSGSGGGPAVDPLKCTDDLWCRTRDILRPACKDGMCVECTKDDDCSGDQPACNTTLNRCETCLVDDHCPSGRCNEALKICVECEVDLDCKDPIKDSCDKERFVCVDCVGSAGCADDDPTGVKTTCYQTAQTCVDCLANSDCGDDKPACNQQTRECVGCNNSGDCNDPVRNQCDTGAKTCVDCVDNAGCSGANPQCDQEANVCVQCLQDSHCASGHCIDQECVECKVDADCPSVTASHCDPATHQCVGCTSGTHCAHLEDTPACNARRCVECNDDSTCGGFACIRAQHVCSDVRRGSVSTCNECEADSMCAADMRCVPLSFAGEAYGNYCVYMRSTRTGGSCTNARPYAQSISSRSVDVATATTYCIPPSTTTCPGVLDVALGASGSTCVNETECGLGGGEDAVCAGEKCTYPCNAMEVNCPPGLTCRPGGLCG